MKLGRRFWQLFASTGVSSLGDGVVTVAFPLLALSFTRNAILIATVAVAGRLPALLVSLPAGAFADRVNRRIMVATIEILRFVVIGAFALLVVAGLDGIPVICVTVFLLGSLTMIYNVVAAACLPSIVASDQLVAANAYLLTADVAAEEMVGQAVGGAAFAAARSIPFIGDAISFVASAGLLWNAIPDTQPARSQQNWWHDVKDGLAHFLDDRFLSLLSGLLATFAFCQAAVMGVLVLYGTQDLHLTHAEYGLLLAVSGVGNIVGALIATPTSRRLDPAQCVVVGGFLATIAYPVLAVTHSSLAAGGALLLEGVAVVVGNVAARAVRQSLVPNNMQGRAAAAYQLIIFGTIPIGGLAGGITSDLIGIRVTFALAGALQLAVLLVVAPRILSWSRRRGAAPPDSERVAP